MTENKTRRRQIGLKALIIWVSASSCAMARVLKMVTETEEIAQFDGRWAISQYHDYILVTIFLICWISMPFQLLVMLVYKDVLPKFRLSLIVHAAFIIFVSYAPFFIFHRAVDFLALAATLISISFILMTRFGTYY